MNTKNTPQELQLSNGIPVVFQHVDSTVATFHWWNITGSADERPDEAGFAHFLEHMLFKDSGAKDTGQPSTGKTARAIENLGGEINAYTSFDQTVYHVTSAEHVFEKVLDSFAVMAKPVRFLKEDFEREREVILEELKRGQDSPTRQLYEKLFGITYKKHPYGRPVIGYVKTLKAATVKKLEAFYQRRYRSGQMGLVVVGPFDADGGARKKKILSILEKHFGAKTIRQKKPDPSRRAIETELQKPRFHVQHFDVSSPEFACAFRIPHLGHPDVPVLDVIASVLGQGESSRLHQELFSKKGWVTDISCSTYVPKDSGMFIFNFETQDSSKIKTILDHGLEIMESFKKSGPTPEELARALTSLESEKLYSHQTVDGIAGRLGFLCYQMGNLDFDKDYLERLRSITAEDCMRVAKHYLTSERFSGVVFQPEKETLIQPDGYISRLTPPTDKPIRVKKRDQYPIQMTLPNGLKIALHPKPGTSVFSVASTSLGGLRSELGLGSDFWGASQMLSGTWTKGAGDLSALDIAKIVEGRAASLDGFAGRNTAGLQMTGLRRDWDRLTRTFETVLTSPRFDPTEIEHTRRVIEDSIRTMSDHSSQWASKLFLEQLFETHPYGKTLTGSLETLVTHDQKQLQHLHRALLNPKTTSLSVVGDFDLDTGLEWLNHLGQYFSTSAPSVPAIPTDEPLRADRWVDQSFGREQTHIIVGGRGVCVTDKNRHALRVLQSILGGQSGRLFIELREKKSLAYSVAPMSMEGIEPGYIGTYIACAPNKKDEAIAGIKHVIETLIRKGPSADEMKRAKNTILSGRAMDLQSSWSLASHYGLTLLYHGEISPEKKIRATIDGVTPTQVQAIGKKLYLDARMVTAVVG